MNDTPIHYRVNYGFLITLFPMAGFAIFLLILIIQSALKTGFSMGEFIGILFPLGLIWLVYESIMLSIIKYERHQDRICFVRPWMRLSRLKKYKYNRCVPNSDWDELYVFSIKSSYTLYFRFQKSAAFVVIGNDLGSIVGQIKRDFPNKLVDLNPDSERPSQVIRAMRKQYPDRVFRSF